MKIVTVCHAPYKQEYADKLEQLCNKYTFDFEFVRLNEQNLEHDWKGWWAKLEAFKIQGPVLYMDVSCVPVGDLNPMLGAVKQHDFLVVHDFNPHQRNVQSCVMGWSGDMSYLYEQFKQNPDRYMQEFEGCSRWWSDQGFIEYYARAYQYWQDVIPGSVVSYKKHCQNGAPKGAKIVNFHGKPKPWEIEHGLDT